MSDKLNKDGFKPGQLLSLDEQKQLGAKQREEANAKQKSKASKSSPASSESSKD